MEKYCIDIRKGIEFGLYLIGDYVLNLYNGDKIMLEKRIYELIEIVKLVDEVGFDVFVVGESY